MKKKARIEEYDLCKGLGIILVIIGHIIPSGNVIKEFIYTFHMPMFFFVSGLVMKDLNIKGLRSIFKKEKRLLVCYIFFSFVFFVYDLIVRFMILRQVGVGFFIRNVYQFITFYGIDVLWFLSSLWFGKIFTRYLWFALKKKIWIFVFSVVCLLLPIVFWNPSFTISNNDIRSYMFYYPLNFITRTILVSGFILLGTVVNSFVNKFIKSKLWWLTSFLLLVNLVCVIKNDIIIDYHLIYMWNGILSIILALSGIIGLLGLCCILYKISLITSVLNYFSRSSMFLMVTHNYLLIIPLVSWLVSLCNFNITGNMRYFLIILGVFIVELVLCLLIEPYVNKLINLIMNVRYTPKSRVKTR